LGAAAATEGYSHERVRQLEAELRRRLRESSPYAPQVAAALRVVEAWAPDSRTHIADQLRRSGVTAASFDPAGVLTAAELTGAETHAVIKEGVVVTRENPFPEGELTNVARRLAAPNGATSVGEVAREVRASPDHVRRLLSLRKEITWLDEPHNWLQLPRTHRRLTTILRKMLSITPSLSLDDANDGLQRSFRPVVLPPAILRRLCESFGWLAVDGNRGTVRTRERLDRASVLSPVELGLVEMFQEAGPVLQYSEAIAIGERLGLNRHSIGVYLTRSPVLDTLSRGRYALRGRLAYDAAAAAA
ncbi:MAG: hypothetical protein H0X39_10305, partial [Actinobacteria bacterium]|nr:hypothetical protein [Actinomycetota bacterium]